MKDTRFINRLTSEHVRDLVPYASARRLFSGGQDWLNANESPFANNYVLDSGNLNRYPDCQPDNLIAAYGHYAGLRPDQVLATRGADEGIELLVRAFCEPGKDKVLICPPTYGMYAISANTFNVGVEKAPLKRDFSLDLQAIESALEQAVPPKLVFLCSPNNPTGTLLAKDQVQAVLTMCQDKALVVLDEAYIEFSPASTWANGLKDNEHLVILRTLSKAFALAGIRCGFTLASPAVLNVLLKVIAPYPVPAPVAQVAEQALSTDGLARMQDQVNALEAEKASLDTELSALPQFTLIGDKGANFLLYRITDKQGLMDALVARGILIRDQSKQLMLEDCLRITIGNREQNQRLVDAIKQYFEQEGQAA